MAEFAEMKQVSKDTITCPLCFDAFRCQEDLKDLFEKAFNVDGTKIGRIVCGSCHRHVTFEFLNENINNKVIPFVSWRVWLDLTGNKLPGYIKIPYELKFKQNLIQNTGKGAF